MNIKYPLKSQGVNGKGGGKWHLMEVGTRFRGWVAFSVHDAPGFFFQEGGGQEGGRGRFFTNEKPLLFISSIYLTAKWQMARKDNCGVTRGVKP